MICPGKYDSDLWTKHKRPQKAAGASFFHSASRHPDSGVCHEILPVCVCVAQLFCVPIRSSAPCVIQCSCFLVINTVVKKLCLMQVSTKQYLSWAGEVLQHEVGSLTGFQITYWSISKWPVCMYVYSTFLVLMTNPVHFQNSLAIHTIILCAAITHHSLHFI